MSRRQIGALAWMMADAIVLVALIIGVVSGSAAPAQQPTPLSQRAGVPQTLSPINSPVRSLQPTRPVVPTRTTARSPTPTSDVPTPTIATQAPATVTMASATVEPTQVTVDPTPTEVPATPTPISAPATLAISSEPVPILMYHYIRPDPGPGDPIGQDLSVSPERFAQELAYLAEQGYTTVTMSQLADAWGGGQPLPTRPIVLTFDDGYRDFYTNAWPLLRQYSFSATIYVITGVIDTSNYLTQAMIRELDASGSIDFGSHTIRHPELATLAEADAEHEIVGSKIALEELLGHAVRTFAYPAGHYNDSALALVATAGYELAVTTEWGYATPSMDHRLLPRLRVRGWTTVDDLANWL
jgi:peptidoglycan/xylan/chitin deacetylase (PgdA/CDA1 family)